MQADMLGGFLNRQRQHHLSIRPTGRYKPKPYRATRPTPTTISDGESIKLMIDDGAGFSVTWPAITWVNNGGAAPALSTIGYTVISIWKVAGVLYGACRKWNVTLSTICAISEPVFECAPPHSPYFNICRRWGFHVAK